MRFPVTTYASDHPNWTLETDLRCTHDLEGRLLSVSAAAARALGYRTEELLNVPLSDLVAPEFRIQIPGYLETIRSVGTAQGLLALETSAGQRTVWEYWNSLGGAANAPIVFGSARDVTERVLSKRALPASEEHAFRESEAKFRLLAETTPSGIFIYREDGTFCYFNPQVEAFTGYTPEELRTMSVWDLVHPDFREVIRARVQSRFRGENVPSRSEFKITTKDGRARWIDFTARFIEYERAPAILGTAFDITDNKRNELQAKEHTALLQTLVANSPFGIMVGGSDHRIRLCNLAFTRIFLYTADEVIGKDPDELVGLPENTEAADISRRVLSGEIVHLTTVRRRKDGSKVNVDLHAIPLMSGNKFTGCFGIYQDITERMESEAKLRALRGRLTRVQDEERAHVARELHDNIAQQLAMLTFQLAEVQATAQDADAPLTEQLETSVRLTRQVSADVHRLSHRLHPTHLAHLGLTRALAALCDEFARQTRIQVDFDHVEIPSLSTDVTTCLYRVAQEALRNAEKHSGTAHVRVELAATSAFVSLSVRDTGLGFAPAAERSSGLGLVSMAERVHGAGGELTVRSALGQGTRIQVSIPLPRSASSAPLTT